MPQYLNIDVRREGPGVTLVLNRPDKLNPLDWDTVRELRDAVSEIEDDSAVRTVAFTGSGRSFSAGGDLEKYLDLFRRPKDFRAFMETFHELFEVMENSGKIFIAAVNGVCVAGGLELLLACDLVIAAEDAKIGDGHLRFGQLPGAGSSVRLWRAVGSVRAKHLMLTGDLLTAREAQQLGLVGEVAPVGQLDEVLRALVGKLHAKTPVGLAGAKRLLNEAIRSDYSKALRAEIAYVQRYATREPDAMEGLLAFKEKRKPRYDGGSN